MTKYHYTDSKGDRQGPYSIAQLKSLKDLRVIGDPSPIWDEITNKTMPLSEVLSVGLKAFPAPPIITSSTIAAPPSKSSGECKICGAARDPLCTNCKFCGTAYTLEKITGQSYIDALQWMLDDIPRRSSATHTFGESEHARPVGDIIGNILGEDTSTGGKRQRTRSEATAQAQAVAISTFAMPNDLDNLLQLFFFCHGNAQINSADPAMDKIIGAWHGKAKMAFAQLKTLGAGNASLQSQLVQYEALYGLSSKLPETSKDRRLKNIVMAITAVGVMVVVALIVGVGIPSDDRERSRQQVNAANATMRAEEQLQEVTQKVQRAVTAGNYDLALMLIEDVRWTYDSTESKLKAYNEKRVELKLQIQEMKKSAIEGK